VPFIASSRLCVPAAVEIEVRYIFSKHNLRKTVLVKHVHMSHLC
jgi:hypothetical protein